MSTPLSRRAGSLLRPVVLLALLFASATSSLRATNYTITASTPESIDLSNVGLQPGDTVFIQGHTRQKLIIQRLTGAPGNPITVTNTGGQFIIDSATSNKGLQFQGCQYVVVQGTPSPGNYDYGIKIAQLTLGGAIGVSFTTHTAGTVITGSTDFEISNVEIGHVGFAGFMAKNDSLKASSGFVMQNVKIHGLYIHDVGGEGIYVGSSFFDEDTTTDVNYDPHHIHNIEIYKNLVINAGWDGIQLGCATQNASIHHNIIVDYGSTGNATQNEGIRSNPGTAADIYNNWIEGNPENSGTGIFANPYNSVKYYNNVIVTPEESGIYITEASARPSYVAGYTVSLINNTVVAPKNYHGIHLSNISHSSGGLVKNNLVADPGVFNGVNGVGLLIGGGNPSVTQLTNLVYETVAEAGFVNAAGFDCHLAPGSPAIDAGTGGPTEVVATDYDDAARPAGANYDVGAFEVVAGPVGLITPAAYGQAGGAFCPATGTFNEQPAWDTTNGVPVGISANAYSGTSIAYANRHWYIDFGANYASLRLTGTWTRYMPQTTASYSGLGAMWWDDDNDSTNDNGVTATGLAFGTAQNLNTVSGQPWVQDTNNTGTPVTPQRRYLIINTGSAPPARANEFAISGFTVY